MLLKEEILPHYQNFRFFLNFQYFEQYAKSVKMSGHLHVHINGCIVYYKEIKE